MRLLSIHAHPDDFEFSGAGWAWSLRARHADLRVRAIVCTDGAAGHHERSRDALRAIRRQEQQAAAETGGFEARFLELPDGSIPREGCLLPDRHLLAALWREIREFEPDYLLCPPMPDDPLAGVHPDHWSVAEAVRRVAYLINVPHAFLPEIPAESKQGKFIATPVILNVYDGYMGAQQGFDLILPVEAALDHLAAITWAHQSQVTEWLPWVARHMLSRPSGLVEWKSMLRGYLSRRASAAGVEPPQPVECFAPTAWGSIPTLQELDALFPGALRGPAWERLAGRLARWGR